MTTTDSTLTLHFVRHGETASNAERRFQTPDVPLSEAGRAQAAAVAATLLDTTGAQTILASDYSRTMETAAAIGQRLELPIVEEPAPPTATPPAPEHAPTRDCRIVPQRNTFDKRLPRNDAETTRETG